MTDERIQEAEEALERDLLGFLEDAVVEVLRLEDEQEFMAWVRSEAPRQLPGLFADLPNEQAARSIAFEMAREVWNKVPLPGAGFRTRPIPRPERNEPCPCGSGQKHKKCCGALAGNRIELPLEAEDAWALVLSRRSEAEVAQLVADRRIPRGLLGGIAETLIGGGDADTALTLLEPLFEEPETLDERDAPAIDALVAAWDELALYDTKEREVARLESALRPALRVVLWESLAQSFTSEGDAGRAWEMAERIRRADPDSPVLGWIEVILLLGENRLDDAAVRARDALSRHQRRPGLSDEALSFLQETGEDPAASRRRLLLDDLLPGVERLEKLVADLEARPIRPYTVRTEGEAPGTGRLITPVDLLEVEDGWMEIAMSSAEDEAEEGPIWVEDDEENEDEEAEDGDLWDSGDEDDWDDEEEDEDDPAEPEDVERWLAHLEAHPESFDSLLVLADLGDRVSALARIDPSLLETLMQPLIARGVAILDASLAGAPPVTLPGRLEENGVALELLQASALFPGEPVPDVKPLERLLELDPEDRLAVRSDLGTIYLWTDQPQKALDLAARFPEDDVPYLSFARVLALDQLERRDEAFAALDEALERYPLTGSAIVRSSPTVPDSFVELWQNNEALWKELQKRVDSRVG